MPYANAKDAAENLAARARYAVEALIALGASCTRLRHATALELTKRAVSPPNAEPTRRASTRALPSPRGPGLPPCPARVRGPASPWQAARGIELPIDLVVSPPSPGSPSSPGPSSPSQSRMDRLLLLRVT